MDVDQLPVLLDRLRRCFAGGRTREIPWRLRQLAGVKRMLVEHEGEALAALREDLGKPPFEADVAELAFTIGEIDLMHKQLPGWVKPERVSTALAAQPGRSRIHREPYGVALIVGTWNYPIQLVLGPLLGAIAAGNCAVVKPSEVAPHASAWLARRLPQYVDAEAIAVVEGGVDVATALLEQRFDKIFYTGSTRVGRIVMAAAAKHLTPVTLELGGKSPCVVDREVDLPTAARRIVWGKFFNAGQTCVAPDYVLAHQGIVEPLLATLAETIEAFYGADPQQSPDYARIINDQHFQRLTALLEGQTVVVGGQHDREQRYIAPTVLRDVSPDAPVMAEEIFGPLLPVIAVPSIEAAIEQINARPKPLALYVFSRDRALWQHVLARTSSGGATINHTWMHLTVPSLPFGGVGESGIGAYHGRHSFEAFSHRKSVLEKSTAIDPPLAYPPYGKTKAKWIKRLL